MQRTIRRTILVLVAALVAGLALTASSISQPRCFGAASRDPEHPCVNHALDHTVTPSVADAPIQPSAPCRPVREARPSVCTFGVAKAPPARSFALIGDSHSVHWRAALAIVARRHRWEGYSLYRTACPFSLGVPPQTGPRQRCPANARDVIGWMNREQAVHTVIVSEHNRVVIPDPGKSERETEIEGYIRAWAQLPATVTKIVVIRDPPPAAPGWQDCVTRSLHRHGVPGIDCRVRRRTVEKPDTAVLAARRVRSPRVRVVDLIHYFCGDRYCFPVIGGVVVHKDKGHITRTYSETLAPYLDRKLTPLLTMP